METLYCNKLYILKIVIDRELFQTEIVKSLHTREINMKQTSPLLLSHWGQLYRKWKEIQTLLILHFQSRYKVTLGRQLSNSFIKQSKSPHTTHLAYLPTPSCLWNLGKERCTQIKDRRWAMCFWAVRVAEYLGTDWPQAHNCLWILCKL